MTMKMQTGFPHPFGGITHSIKLPPQDMFIAVKHMAQGCGQGHAHNIAVQFDGGYIWTTDLGISCIRKAIGK